METLLWVENDPSLLYLYQEEFAEEGYHLILAKDEEEAIEGFEKSHPHLVVMEIFLPLINGIESLIIMRSKKPSIPIILNTTFGDCQDKFGSWGIEGCVIKSSDLTELKKRIRSVLMHHKSHSAS